MQTLEHEEINSKRCAEATRALFQLTLEVLHRDTAMYDSLDSSTTPPLQDYITLASAVKELVLKGANVMYQNPYQLPFPSPLPSVSYIQKEAQKNIASPTAVPFTNTSEIASQQAENESSLGLPTEEHTLISYDTGIRDSKEVSDAVFHYPLAKEDSTEEAIRQSVLGEVVRYPILYIWTALGAVPCVQVCLEHANVPLDFTVTTTTGVPGSGAEWNFLGMICAFDMMPCYQWRRRKRGMFEAKSKKKESYLFKELEDAEEKEVRFTVHMLVSSLYNRLAKQSNDTTQTLKHPVNSISTLADLVDWSRASSVFDTPSSPSSSRSQYCGVISMAAERQRLSLVWPLLRQLLVPYFEDKRNECTKAQQENFLAKNGTDSSPQLHAVSVDDQAKKIPYNEAPQNYTSRTDCLICLRDSVVWQWDWECLSQEDQRLFDVGPDAESLPPSPSTLSDWAISNNIPIESKIKEAEQKRISNPDNSGSLTDWVKGSKALGRLSQLHEQRFPNPNAVALACKEAEANEECRWSATSLLIAKPACFGIPSRPASSPPRPPNHPLLYRVPGCGHCILHLWLAVGEIECVRACLETSDTGIDFTYRSPKDPLQQSPLHAIFSAPDDFESNYLNAQHSTQFHYCNTCHQSKSVGRRQKNAQNDISKRSTKTTQDMLELLQILLDRLSSYVGAQHDFVDWSLRDAKGRDVLALAAEHGILSKVWTMLKSHHISYYLRYSSGKIHNYLEIDLAKSERSTDDKLESRHRQIPYWPAHEGVGAPPLPIVEGAQSIKPADWNSLSRSDQRRLQVIFSTSKH